MHSKVFFFSARLIDVWNGSSDSIDLSSSVKFKSSVNSISFFPIIWSLTDYISSVIMLCGQLLVLYMISLAVLLCSVPHCTRLLLNVIFWANKMMMMMMT